MLIGDTLTRTSTIADVSEKTGRTGTLVFVKVRHEIVCSACGREATVPFVPRADRPVYCRDCFRRVEGERPRHGIGGIGDGTDANRRDGRPWRTGPARRGARGAEMSAGRSRSQFMTGGVYAETD